MIGLAGGRGAAPAAPPDRPTAPFRSVSQIPSAGVIVVSGTARFWAALDALVVTHEIVIDRPRGSHHPRFPDLVYPMDYGYLAGTVGGDGDGVDLWRGSLKESLVVGVIMTVDLRDQDAELKILIGCTPEEAAVALAVQNRGFQSGLLVMRT